MRKPAAAATAAAALREGARIKLALARTHRAAFGRTAALLLKAVRAGRTVFFAGNGGSAADAQHLAAEFVGRFMRPRRRALPAVALTTDTSALTAIANDFGFEWVFARQVEALGRRGDILVALSTSGTSPNILEAVRAARTRGMAVIGLTGTRGTSLASLCDAAFVVPATTSPRIQEAHIAIGHILCGIIDDAC